MPNLSWGVLLKEPAEGYWTLDRDLVGLISALLQLCPLKKQVLPLVLHREKTWGLTDLQNYMNKLYASKT